MSFLKKISMKKLELIIFLSDLAHIFKPQQTFFLKYFKRKYLLTFVSKVLILFSLTVVLLVYHGIKILVVKVHGVD